MTNASRTVATWPAPRHTTVLIDLIFELTGLSISVITPTVLLPRAIRIALHLAGLGHRRPARKV